jgi:hypothetical protein
LKEGNQKENTVYMERINAAKSKIENSRLVHEIEHISNEILEAKNTMSPYTLIVCSNVDLDL